MTLKSLLLFTAFVAATTVPSCANGSTFGFSFSAPGVSGTVTLSYGTATDGRYSQGFEVTGISGTFSDSNNNLNIVNAPIGSLLALTHSMPESGNMAAPNDFSKIAVLTGLPQDSNGFVTYDNLYYPAGSPPTATDYTAHGGFLDIYGLAFTIPGGNFVNFWSNGSFDPHNPNAIDYGVSVSTVSTSLDYVVGGVTATPEPGTIALGIGGLVGLLTWRNFARRKSSDL